LLAALALHAAALGSTAGALLVLGLLCRGDAACSKKRKRGNAGQQCMSIPHQALSFPVGYLRCRPPALKAFPGIAMLLPNAH
jgi:hypothetical protein